MSVTSLARPRPLHPPHLSSRVLTTLVAAALAAAALAGCSSEDAGTPDAGQLSDFRSRAAAATQASYTATYTLDQSDAKSQATVAVAHTPTDLRLDIATKSGVTTSITTPDGTIACQAPAKAAPTCLQAAAAGKEPPASLDPGLRGVFTTTLDQLGQGFGTVEVVGTPADLDAETICGRVTGNDVTNGLYCLLPNGVIEVATFASGSLALQDQQGAPAPSTFAPPASPRPIKG